MRLTNEVTSDLRRRKAAMAVVLAPLELGMCLYLGYSVSTIHLVPPALPWWAVGLVIGGAIFVGGVLFQVPFVGSVIRRATPLEIEWGDEGIRAYLPAIDAAEPAEPRIVGIRWPEVIGLRQGTRFRLATLRYSHNERVLEHPGPNDGDVLLISDSVFNQLSPAFESMRLKSPLPS